MGGQYEREFVNLLEKHGFAVMRAPSSGSGTERELPDVVALRSNESGLEEAYAIEHKTNSEHHIYLTEDEVDKLVSFAAAGGLIPLLSGRWKEDHDAGWNHHNDEYDTTGYYLLTPHQCYRTDGGNYRITRPDESEFPEWPNMVVTDDSVSYGEVIGCPE